MMSELEAVVTVDVDNELLRFHVHGHEKVELTLALSKDENDREAFDWLAGSASQIIIAGLNRVVDEYVEV